MLEESTGCWGRGGKEGEGREDSEEGEITFGMMRELGKFSLFE